MDLDKIFVCSQPATEKELLATILDCKDISEFVAIIRNCQNLQTIVRSRAIMMWMYQSDHLDYLRVMRGRMPWYVADWWTEQFKDIAGPKIQEHLGIGFADLSKLSL